VTFCYSPAAARIQNASSPIGKGIDVSVVQAVSGSPLRQAQGKLRVGSSTAVPGVASGGLAALLFDSFLHAVSELFDLLGFFEHIEG
jgi:hypothetical protein